MQDRKPPFGANKRMMRGSLHRETSRRGSEGKRKVMIFTNEMLDKVVVSRFSRKWWEMHLMFWEWQRLSKGVWVRR